MREYSQNSLTKLDKIDIIVYDGRIGRSFKNAAEIRNLFIGLIQER